MNAIAKGCGGEAITGPPPDDGSPFVIWGHRFMSEKVLPRAHEEGRPYWFVDNGFWNSAKGTSIGFYSLSYKGIWPVLLKDPDKNRNRVSMKPWQNRKGSVLIALPGMSYGHMFGFNMSVWVDNIVCRVRNHTNQKVFVRPKTSKVPLAEDLRRASVLVTHSSKVAVDAVIEGVPCIVEPTNPAAPVCSLSLDEIERPRMPDREMWWQSLMCQQFTLDEMADGTASFWMQKVEEHHVGNS